MGTWSIEGEGASITQSGVVSLPSLASGTKTYTVSYTSGDGGCTCTHVITQSAQACSCTGYGVTANTSEYGAMIGPYNDGQQWNAGTFDFGTCPQYVLPRFEFIEGSGVDFAYLFALERHNGIVCTVKNQNVGYGNSPRSAKYRVYFGPTPNKEECSVELTVWQGAGSPSPPPCVDCVKLSDNASSDCTAGTPIHHSWNDGDGTGTESVVNGTTSTTPGVTISGTRLDYAFGNVGPNTTSSFRTIGTISLSYTGGGGYCSSGSITVVQCPQGKCYNHTKQQCEDC